MVNFFRQPDRRQRFLLPIDMMDWLPKDDIVHLIVDAVELMDLRRFEASYSTSGPGQAPFSPAMMLALLIYAYSNKVRSSRKIEQLCRRDAGFRLIVGDAVPDHSVIARFRRRHTADMQAVFVEVLKLCREGGLLRLGVVALDGTKIKANAALDANRTDRSLAEEVAAMFAEADAVDAAEDGLYGDRRGDELPPELADAGSRKARLAACREKLTAKAAEAAAHQQQKIDARAAEEQATGKGKRGRKPKPADDSVDPDALANVTDPDSEIMKTRRGWVQGYNGQAVVTADQIIVAAELSSEANDLRQLQPMLNQAQAVVAAVVGEDVALGTVLADAGYWSKANAATETVDCELLIATQKDHRQRTALREAPPPRGRMPKTLTPRQRMDRKLRTKRGRALYRLRGQTVEPVFGQVKEQQGADRFMMRGIEACRGEWKLHAAAHNLRKLHRRSIQKVGNTPKRAIA
jgi:transposase